MNPTTSLSLEARAAETAKLTSPWGQVWRRFRRHRLAMLSAGLVTLLLLVALGADFLATGSPGQSEATLAYLPPQSIRWFDDGQFEPHVLGIRTRRDPETLQRIFALDPDDKIPVGFLVKGSGYLFLGLVPGSRHLIGLRDRSNRHDIYLLGTDKLGRDIWSRLIYGTRISMSIGLLGVLISLLLGVTLGGISGLYGGWIDSLIQRLIEILRSIPTIPLWMGLAAALPKDWSILKVYFAVTVIISLLSWTQMAREVRGKFLALREEDFVVSARLIGCGQMRIIFRHMVPSFTSHIIAVTTLAIPRMIISETALSFLGLGLRPPAVSWGVLLQEAQTIQTVALYPWLLTPALVVIVAVLTLNFVGDGLRDAADPYGI